MAGIGALQPMGSDRGLGRSCPIPVVAQHRLNGAVGWKSANSFRRPEAAIRATAGEPSGYGLFRRTARRKIREYAPLGATVVAVQA